MSKFKTKSIKNSFKNSGKGLRLVLKSERNIRVHSAVAVLVLIVSFVLKLSVVKICIVLFAIAQVMVTEMLNTGLEFTIDAIYHNKYSKMIGMAKDISAAAVLFATVISIIVGFLIFVPEIVNHLSSL